MELRIKELSTSKGVSLQDLSKKLGISYQALNARMIGNPSVKVLKEIADALEVDLHELFTTSDAYSHFYDTETGEWLGIRKK
ncbi:helix-turn-helix domain-containing protein [Riemerella columbina]|uniref:helix-turn-helix domain-containing protein n=1 Tax=Riemerella columbina TaxID=103810 RepID=UPI00037E0B26|nr:helix-turn-helix transcriptional regulator [Riemerella columbina]